jgi:group I intron endonuclease
MKSGIYKFTNILNNKVYIGSSINIDIRYSAHIRGKGKSKILWQAILKYGISNFTFEILEIHDGLNFDTKELFRDYLFQREQFYFNQYFAKEYIESKGKDRRFTTLTYNLSPVAMGGGAKWSQESIDNLKKKFKENGHTCIDRVCTEETRNKMSTVHKERGVSAGKNNPNYGVKQTLEKTAKVKEAFLKSGRIKAFNAVDKSGKVYGPYLTSTECANDLDIWKCQVKKCLAGKPKYKTASGYSFNYVTDEKS